MWRYVLIFLFVLVLGTPMLLRAVYTRPTEAPKNNAETLVIITPHLEPIRREFRDAFSKYHQEKFGTPVDINYLVFGGAADIHNVLQSRQETLFAKDGTYEIDLAWGGGNSTFDKDLKPYLQGLQLDPQLIKDVYPNQTLAGMRLFEGSIKKRGQLLPFYWVPGMPVFENFSPPLWYGTCLSSFGIAFNRDEVKYLGVGEPKTWADLKDPRYRGWIVLSDPTRSSVAKTAFMAIVERAMADAVEQGRSADQGWAEGMGLIRQIAANVRSFNDGSSAPPALVSSGEVAAAMTIDFYARGQIQYVGDARMGYVEPANATVINPDPVALLKGAQHRKLAVQFIEFLLSEQGQKLFDYKAGTPGGPMLTSLRRLPIRPSVYQDMTNMADKANPFQTTSNFNTLPSRTATYSIIGELIQASCIDPLDDLKATRAEILFSPHAAELDAKLGVFPFDQPEALRRMKEYLSANMVHKLELMRQWTDEFRAEYRTLREQAEK